MELFIARQPIFNSNLRIFGYELLYRGTETHNLADDDGDRATASVLSSTFLTEGIDKISDSKPCFINFTRNLLIRELPEAFPNSQIIVEILENVSPAEDVLRVCQKLKNAGYTIALDDFIYDRSLIPLIELADIIKFDCLLTPIDTLFSTLKKLNNYKLKYLAEKVETYEEFEKARKLGFSYFQGYFFRKPEKINIREIASAKINLVNLLAEINKKSTTVKRLEKIIGSDVAISYKLLRYINSSYFYRLNRIESVTHAITYLGSNEIRRFVSLVIISELATDKPEELVRLALIRAKFLELLVLETKDHQKLDELFLLGLFSLLDAILDTEMEVISNRLPISDSLRDALISKKGNLAPFLQVLLTYENHDKKGCMEALAEIGAAPNRIGAIYLEAITFARSVLQ